jgi:hypothetical protein
MTDRNKLRHELSFDHRSLYGVVSTGPPGGSDIGSVEEGSEQRSDGDETDPSMSARSPVPSIQVPGDIEAHKRKTKQMAEHSQISKAHRGARMLDKSAAIIVAGTAALNMQGVVWVNCNPEAEWFDQTDSRRLMKIAWDGVIERDQQFAGQVTDMINRSDQNRMAATEASRVRNIGRVLRDFRRQQLEMQVHALSPSTESVMLAMVIDMGTEFDEIEGVKGPVDITTKFQNRAVGVDDRERRMVRMLRRIPLTRNQFCRNAGNLLRYNLALQDGTALSTRRINQLQTDMRKSNATWNEFVANNITAIVRELTTFMQQPWHIYTFDWVSYRLKKIDTEEYVGFDEDIITQVLDDRDDIEDKEDYTLRKRGDDKNSQVKERAAARRRGQVYAGAAGDSNFDTDGIGNDFYSEGHEYEEPRGKFVSGDGPEYASQDNRAKMRRTGETEKVAGNQSVYATLRGMMH